MTAIHKDTAPAIVNANDDGYGSALLDVINASEQSESGPLFMAHEYHNRLCIMADNFAAEQASKGSEFSSRAFFLEQFYATPEGEKHVVEFERLKAKKKDKTQAEKVRFTQLSKRANKINTQMQRMLACNDGVRALRAAGRVVEFDVKRENGMVTNVACFVLSPALKEFIPTQFTIKALQNVTAGDLAWNDTTPTATVFTMARDYTATPNGENKANGDAIEPAKIGATVKALDTSIAGKTLAKDGGISPAARNELFALWARLDSMMSVEQKAKAIAAFNADAAPADAPAVEQPKANKRKAKAA